MSFEGTLLSLSELYSDPQNFKDVIIMNILKRYSVSVVLLSTSFHECSFPLAPGLTKERKKEEKLGYKFV